VVSISVTSFGERQMRIYQS